MEQGGRLQPQARLSADKNLLQFLGLQLLDKGLRLPCAVVQPRIQESPNIPLSTGGSGGQAVTELLKGKSENSQPNPRKRKRNASDDLSMTERREKRKMMNRVAAQNARDRKKHYVEELERKVALLEAQNKQLHEENQALRTQTTTLTTEKTHLEQQLMESHQTDFLHTLVKESRLEPCGSAAETGSEGSPAPSVGDSQFDVLAGLLEEGSSPSSPTLSPSPDLTDGVTWGSCDPVVKGPATEDTGLVGALREQVEPTKELRFDISDGCSTGSENFLDFLSPLCASTSGYSEEALLESELEKLLQPFADGIVGTNPEFDIEALLAV